MAEQSLIVSMWDEILENYDEQDRGAFVGGGAAAVERLEAKLGFTLPQEFADYVRFYCPSENLGVAELFQGTSPVASDHLGESDYQDAYDLDDFEADDALWLVFAVDNEDALITNLKDEHCPVYYYSADEPEIPEVAPNLAHALYLLGYWQRLQEENSGVDGEAPEWREVISTFQAKLNVLAPGVAAKAWNFDKYPYTYLESS